MSDIFGYFLKCDVPEGWRRSVGPIEWKMKNFMKESMRRGISYIQQKKQD